MSSNAPAAAHEVAAVTRARCISVLDAPTGCGVAAAEAGTLHLFAGSNSAVMERCRPVLEALAGQISHVGGNGWIPHQAAGEPAVGSAKL